MMLGFGKWRGVELDRVPVKYLDWLIGQAFIAEGLRDRIVRHLQTRAEWMRMGSDALDEYQAFTVVDGQACEIGASPDMGAWHTRDRQPGRVRYASVDRMDGGGVS